MPLWDPTVIPVQGSLRYRGVADSVGGTRDFCYDVLNVICRGVA